MIKHNQNKDGKYGDIYDFFFTMKGPFDKLGSRKGELDDAVQAMIQVNTGLLFQNRIQHFYNDLFTDFEVLISYSVIF